MSTKHLSLVSIIIILSFLLSCKKEPAIDNSNPTPPDTNNNNNNNNNTADAVYLSKWFGIDSTLAAPLDTVVRMSFTYDANHRPSTIVYTDFKPNGDSNFYWHVSYEYNGNDTFAHSTIESMRELFQPTIYASSDTIYYHFSNAVCERDSLAGNGFYETNSYTYVPGYIQRSLYQKTFSGQPHTTTGSSRVYQTKVDGKLTYQLDTLTRHLSPGNPTVNNYLRNEYSISYLNNPDPFYKITAPVKSEIFGKGDWYPFGKYVSGSLLSDVTYSTSQWDTGGAAGTTTGTTHYSYVFRADGYPVEGRATYEEAGIPTRTFKSVYIYQ